MFSDKVLSLKAFDSSGGFHKQSGRAQNGSNYYPDSNIRQWLNSSDKTITWLQNAPSLANLGDTPYNEESGFLADGNFSAKQRELIVPLTHKALLAEYDAGKKDGGSARLSTTEMQTKLSVIIQNDDTTAFFKNVTDSVFLLSTKQLKDWVSARGYSIVTKPTQQAVDAFNKINNYTDKSPGFLKADDDYAYWLNTPVASSTFAVRYVDTDNDNVYVDTPTTTYYGVRPAVKINLTATNFAAGGAGTVAKPYVVSNGAPIPADTKAPTVPTKLVISDIKPSSLTVSWNASTDNVAVTNYEVYRNGKLVGTTKSRTYKISGLKDNGIQTFTVRALDAAGNKSAASSASKTKPMIQVDGNKLYENFQLINLGKGVTPTKVKGTTLVPYKPVLEAMGLKTSLNSKSDTITATSKGMTLKLTQGKTAASVNGKNKTLSVAPTEVKGTLMIPLNFVAKELGYTVIEAK